MHPILAFPSLRRIEFLAAESRYLGELAQSKWRLGADVLHHHRPRQRTGRNDPRPHAGHHPDRAARALARRRARPARSAAAVSGRTHKNDPSAALKIETFWWARRRVRLCPHHACLGGHSQAVTTARALRDEY